MAEDIGNLQGETIRVSRIQLLSKKGVVRKAWRVFSFRDRTGCIVSESWGYQESKGMMRVFYLRSALEQFLQRHLDACYDKEPFEDTHLEFGSHESICLGLASIESEVYPTPKYGAKSEWGTAQNGEHVRTFINFTKCGDKLLHGGMWAHAAAGEVYSNYLANLKTREGKIAVHGENIEVASAPVAPKPSDFYGTTWGAFG